MPIADRFGSLLSRLGTTRMQTKGGGFDPGPVPLQIGKMQKRNPYALNNISSRGKIFLSLSPTEKKQRIENRLCFICGKPGCIARNHFGSNRCPTNISQKKAWKNYTNFPPKATTRGKE